MGRRPQTKAEQQAAALKKAAELFSVKLDTSTLNTGVETTDDLMREAASVLDFHESMGDGFNQKTCKTCQQTFFYKWNSKAISYCSVSCMSKALEAIGIKWDPSKLPEERWGPYIPSIVPPAAAVLVQEMFETPEDLLDYIENV